MQDLHNLQIFYTKNENPDLFKHGSVKLLCGLFTKICLSLTAQLTFPPYYYRDSDSTKTKTNIVPDFCIQKSFFIKQ